MDADVDMHGPEADEASDPGTVASADSEASDDILVTDLMRSFSVMLNTKLRVVICHCGHVVDLPRLTLHFANHASEGRSDAGPRLALLIKEFRTLGVVDGLPDLSPCLVPREPIAGIPVALVYGCSACVYHCGDRSKVDKHCKKYCPNRDTADPTPSVLDLHVQRPLQNQGYVRIIHDPPNAAIAPLVNAMIKFQADRVQKLRREEQDQRLVSPLLVRTGWHQHVAGHDIASLVAAAVYPGKDEFPGLADGVLAYFQRATDLLQSTDRLVLQKLNTPEPARTGLNHEPLHRHQEHETSLASYVRPVVNILAILLRRATGSYEIPSSPALTAAVDVLRDKSAEGSRLRRKYIHEAVYALWFREWGREAAAQTVVDPTLATLTLLALRPDGSFVDASGLTGILAKLTRAIQLTAVFEVHGQMSLAKNPSVGFQLQQTEHLERYVQEGQLTTFASVRSLQHYATAISYSSVNVPRIWWTDTKTWQSLLYRGRKFTLDHLRRILARVQSDVISSFEYLTAGVDTDLCYDDLMDDPRNRDNGYTAADPLRPALRQRFEEASSRIVAAHGLLDPKTGKLDALACRKFLSRMAALDRALMLAVHMGSGGPPRGTELTCMMYRNTAERLRNLFMFGTRPCILRAYNKTTSNQQRDKVIPNALDAVTGDVIFRKVLFLNPIAAYIAPAVWPERAEEVSQLYYTMLFVDFGELFTTDDVSKAMTAVAIGICGWALIISAYRHIYIAFARKLLHHRDEEAEDAEEVDANQAGHTGPIGRAHYGLSHQTFVGADEDTVRAFTDNSDVHCRNVGIRPGGDGLPYYEVTVASVEQAQQEAAAAAAAAPPPPTLARAIEVMLTGFSTIGGQMAELISTQQSMQTRIEDLEARFTEGNLHGAHSPSNVPPPSQAPAASQPPVSSQAPPSSWFPNIRAPPPPPSFEVDDAGRYTFSSGAPPVSPAMYTHNPRCRTGAQPSPQPAFPSTPSRQSRRSHSGTSSSPASFDEEVAFWHDPGQRSPGVSPHTLKFSLPDFVYTPQHCAAAPGLSPPAQRPLRPLQWRDPPLPLTSSHPSVESIGSVSPSPPPAPSSSIGEFDTRASPPPRYSDLALPPAVPPSSIHAFDLQPLSQRPLLAVARRPSTQTSSVHAFDRPPSPARTSTHVRRKSASNRAALPRPVDAAPFRPVLFFPVPPELGCVYDQPYPSAVRARAPPDDMIHFARDLVRRVTAVWTCVEQRAAIIALLRLDRDVFISLRTAAGKSLIAVLPSLVERGITVILVPLRALFADWIRRLQEMRVEFESFETGGKSVLTGDAQLILVSVDVAEQHHWRMALQGLLARGCVITRIVVDEIQLSLSQSFRKSLRNVHELRFAPCPLVLLSATIPPLSVPWFTDRFKVDRPLVIRGLSIRKEIAYDLQPPFESAQALVRPVQELQKLLTTDGDRYMIFVSSISTGQQIAQLLDIELFHGLSNAAGRVMTATMQTDIYTRWTSGVKRGIVTTNALSAGNDYPHVRFVLHATTPYNAVDYIQESGRAGRDGRDALAVIYPYRLMPDSGQPQDIKDISGSSVVEHIVYRMSRMDPLNPERCIRYALGLFNDGIGKSCLQVRDCRSCTFCVEHRKLLRPDQQREKAQQAIDECNPPPLQPLVPSAHMPKIRSQGELRELLLSRFGPSQQLSESLTIERLGTEADEISRFLTFLNMTKDTCGYCFVSQLLRDQRTTTPGYALHHNPNHCPLLTEPDKSLFFKVRKDVSYNRDKEPGPCFTCHFPSMGSDTLHPPYLSPKEYHAHRNLILPMLWAVRYASEDLYTAAVARFHLGVRRRHHWDTPKGMALWVGDHDATPFPVSGLALIAFVTNYFDLGTD
ncbi:hypothetical protein BD626DRAFT_577388 [Schizophyllum amplum]|uniref:DNA 3'-5' helicase n=1 Tax=Schizophyllum amplum TaxID=97359 RepID=A0A550BSK6_9AGAR|nr:hypothetical protein BD626DRAFT_577388 [Auriculariopsis ampla]